MADELRDITDLTDAVFSLAADFSMEVTPREVTERPGRLGELLPPGTRVFLTHFPHAPFSDTLAAASALTAQGMHPVPHLAARSIADLRQLDRMAGRLAATGVEEALVIAGSADRPRGVFGESMQVLRSGVLARHGIRRVGVAGHPEGSGNAGPDRLARALREKNALAAHGEYEMYLLTRFCFSAGPVVEWERRIRAAGNRLPVRVGLPGLTSPADLARFGVACGIGPSLKVLRKHTGGMFRLARNRMYYPDDTLLGLARSVREDPGSLVRGVHFFPFGALRQTAEWVQQISRVPSASSIGVTASW